ncbi:extracellular solute-binding protein [Microbacterium oryzae]|uniref:ABC transporter substrate-binding protein n=1 Tax=Microbacterium oryzae TaxID=743009 RepID=UPI0025AFA10B|nr:extracellular solute-binding protein [Microbacterium oryzae]MDN3311608.1 extracellular solute-binding protein [Microbacterium oryzae]
MTTYRKARAWTTVAVIGLTASLAACSSGGTGALGGGGEEGGATKLVIPVNESPWLDAYKALVAQYEEESGVDVELRVFPYDEMRTQVLNDIQSGTQIYDVFQIDEPNLHEFFINGWVAPFSEIDSSFEEDPGLNQYADFTRWDADARVSSPDGEVMVQPLNGNVQLLTYRTDLYEHLGLDVPETWDDVVANGQVIQDAGAANYGYVLRTQGSTGGSAQITYDFLPLLYAFDASWFTDEGTDWTPAVTSPEAIQAATMLRQLAELGPAETTTIGQAQAIGAMQAGESGQAQLVAAAAPQLESEADSNIVGKVGFAELPAGPGGTHGVASGVWALGVPAGLPDERSQAALDYIEWMMSKDAQVAFTELGGIPTRSDVLDVADIDDSTRAYLEAVQSSLGDVRPHVRYAFSAEMLTVTEQRLSQIAAGSVTPEEGMAGLQEDLTAIVEEAGYPMGAS